eukprot:Filipodium_phascolosomae@DN6762_c0_g1_i1.p1
MMGSSLQFWLVTGAMFSLTPVTEMVSWWPTYLAWSLDFSPGAGAALAAVFPLGFVLSMMVSGTIYDRLKCSQRLYFISGLMVVSCLSIIMLRAITPNAAKLLAYENQSFQQNSPAKQFIAGQTTSNRTSFMEEAFVADTELLSGGGGFDSGVLLNLDDDDSEPDDVTAADWTSWIVVSALLLVLGCSIAPPFYIPMNVYSSNVGGKRHSSTLSGILDAMGYVSTTFFMKLAGSRANKDQWIEVMDMLVILACGGTIFLTLFMYRNIRFKEC